jgi:hypothetical protein
VNSLLALDENRGYRAPSKLADSLTEIWARNGEVDAWEIAGRVFDLSWNMVRSDNYGEPMEENNDTGCEEWQMSPKEQDYDPFV